MCGGMCVKRTRIKRGKKKDRGRKKERGKWVDRWAERWRGGGKDLTRLFIMMCFV